MIWDSQTGTQLHNLVSHLNNVITVAFSPDGKKIVSGADDDENNLIIWDSETGQQLHDLSQPNDVLTAALSPDGKKIVAGIRKSLIVWDCKTGQQLHKLVGHPDDITSVAFSPDSSIIVSGCRGKKNNLIMWNSATGQPLHIFNNAPQEVKIITFSPDGRKFGCSTNNSILIFPLLSAEEEKALDNCTFEQAHLLYQVSLAAAAKANIRPLLLQRINALPPILQDIAKRFLTINHSRSLSN